MRRALHVLALLSCLLAAGCDDPSTPLIPTVPTPPQPSPPAPSNVQTYIRGLVTDTVWRPIPEALVEIADGPLAGTRQVADNDGRFEFASMSVVRSVVTLRASRDGFQTTSGAATWQPEGDRPIVVMRLNSLEPPLALEAGEYRLNLTIDLSTARGRPPQLPWETEVPCQGLPVELASRSYDASITERPLGERIVSIKGPTVQPFSGFQLFVAGDHVAFEIELEPRRGVPGIPLSLHRRWRAAGAVHGRRGIGANPVRRRVQLLRTERVAWDL